MKKIASLLLVALTLSTITGTALAAETSPPALYPTEVTEYTEGEAHRLAKVYLLTTTDDPTGIPTVDFTRDGFTYTLLDMTRTDQTATDAKPHTEAIAVESKSKEMDKILPLLASTKEVTAGDGYTGLLTLDTASIKVEAAGYGSSSRTVTATRSYWD